MVKYCNIDDEIDVANNAVSTGGQTSREASRIDEGVVTRPVSLDHLQRPYQRIPTMRRVDGHARLFWVLSWLYMSVCTLQSSSCGQKEQYSESL